MPEYLICVKENGKKYCWDQESGQIEEIRTNPISVKNVPEKVVIELMRGLGREAKAYRDGHKKIEGGM